MARSAVLAGRTAADTVSVTVQTVLMLIVAYLIGYRIHEGGCEALLAFVGVVSVGYAFTWVAAFAGLVAEDDRGRPGGLVHDRVPVRVREHGVRAARHVPQLAPADRRSTTR